MDTFPLEILNEIFKLGTCASSLKDLRLVCRNFNAAIVPIMFRHLKISYRYPLVDFLRILRAICSGRHPYKAHARTLTINGLGPDADYLYAEVDDEYIRSYNLHYMKPYRSRTKVIKRLLRLAITSCSRVTAVSWSISDTTSEYWNREVVLGAIKRLPLLASLKLYMRRPYIIVDPLPPLEELVITGLEKPSFPGLPILLEKSSRTLRRLELGTAGILSREGYMSSFIRDKPLHITEITLWGTIFLDKAFIPSLRGLQSLNLGSHPPFHSFGTQTVVHDTWRLLKEERVHLLRITLRNADKSFLEYLRSYSGLKSVSLRENGHPELVSHDVTLEECLESLNTHASTLENLSVDTQYEGKWSFEQSTIPALQKLVSLKSLSLAIVADSRSTVQREHRVIVRDMNSNVIYGNVEREFGIMTNYNPSHPACILLESAASLPSLELLEINFSMLVQEPETPTPSIIEHAVHPSVQVDTHILMYGPLDPERFRFDVMCENRYYRLMRVGDDGFWYRYVGNVRS